MFFSCVILPCHCSWIAVVLRSMLPLYFLCDDGCAPLFLSLGFIRIWVAYVWFSCVFVVSVSDVFRVYFCMPWWFVTAVLHVMQPSTASDILVVLPSRVLFEKGWFSSFYLFLYDMWPCTSFSGRLYFLGYHCCTSLPLLLVRRLYFVQFVLVLPWWCWLYFLVSLGLSTPQFEK